LKDPIRKKEVVETPEERVRQAVIVFLHDALAIPKGLIAVEKAHDQQGFVKRTDLVVYSRSGEPWMVVECKAPKVVISQRTFEQVSNYNRKYQAPYLLVTNGKDHFCASVDGDAVSFLDQMPSWE
jgi:type I site-specific restriction endonuclease